MGWPQRSSDRRRRRAPAGITYPITINFDGDLSRYLEIPWLQSGGNVLNDQIVLGAELLTNGDMEAGDPPTSWTAIVSTLDGVADERTGGSGSQSLSVSNNGGQGRAQQAITTVAGAWYDVNGWLKKVDANALLRLIDTSAGTAWGSKTVSLTDWTNTGFVARALDVDGTIQLLNGDAVGTNEARSDDITIKAQTFTSIINSLKNKFGLADGFFIDVYINAVTTGYQVGVIWNYDGANNFGMAYMDGTNLVVDKNVGGTYTNLASVAQAVTQDQILRIENPTGTNALSIKYNGVEKATPTIADAGIISNTGIALFSTEAANAISKVVIGQL